MGRSQNRRAPNLAVFLCLGNHRKVPIKNPHPPSLPVSPRHTEGRKPRVSRLPGRMRMRADVLAAPQQFFTLADVAGNRFLFLVEIAWVSLGFLALLWLPRFPSAFLITRFPRTSHLLAVLSPGVCARRHAQGLRRCEGLMG